MKYVRLLKQNKKEANEQYTQLRKEIRQIIKEHQAEFDELAK